MLDDQGSFLLPVHHEELEESVRSTFSNIVRVRADTFDTIDANDNYPVRVWRYD